MPYIGRQPLTGRYTLLDNIASSFNGSLTNFTMKSGGTNVQVFLAHALIVSLGGVIQRPETDYTVSGTTLTFTSPPVAGTTFFASLLGDTLNVGQPSDKAVITRTIADNNVTAAKLATGAVTAGKIATGGVSANTQIAAGIVTGHAIASGNIQQYHISSSVSLGGSQFRGNNGTVGAAGNLGDIFRVANNIVTTNVTINNGLNASAAGPLSIATGSTLTVNGVVVIL